MNDQINPESLLIVKQRGILTRLKCPFLVISRHTGAQLIKNNTYTVRLVLINPTGLMVYILQEHKQAHYPYYYFYIIHP